jgi:glycosyltransferase involved in cell wall biosynthesis
MVQAPVWALDATLLEAPMTGIGLYTRQLIDAFSQAGASIELWGAQSRGDVRRERSSRSRFTWLELPQQLKTRRPALFHAFGNFNLPLTKPHATKLVLTVHDLIPLLLPSTVSTAFRWQFRVALTRAVRVADAIVCVSEVTRQSLADFFPEAREKMEVVHHGVDHVAQHAAIDRLSLQFIDALALPELFVLYAGALDARKNVELVLDAVKQLNQQGRKTTLALAGQPWFGSQAIERRIRQTVAANVDVRMLGHLSDSVFYEVMRRAAVFTFCSRYEGFGLPPLEAMSLGVPTIVSRGGALAEVCAEGAQYVEPDDVMGLARAIDSLLGSHALRRAWSAKALERAQVFRWSETAAQTARIYRHVLQT